MVTEGDTGRLGFDPLGHNSRVDTFWDWELLGDFLQAGGTSSTAPRGISRKRAGQSTHWRFVRDAGVGSSSFVCHSAAQCQ